MKDPFQKVGLVGRRIENLPTPCLIVERPALFRNLVSLQKLLDEKGKFLRAHAKTHKSSRVARWQLEGGAIGVCVAKLSEAEGLIEKGIADILITGPVATDEAHERLIRCLSVAPGLMVTLDDLGNARRLAVRAASLGLSLPCLIDLDPGFHRTGVPLDQAMAFAQELRQIPQVRVRGIQCYAGDLQHIVSREERASRTGQVLRAAAGIFHQYRDLGLDMRIFSVGGTGTVQFDVDIPEVTELQAGSYAFMDVEYAQIEWGDFLERPGTFETSLFLLSTVVTANHPGFATIDAGLKALYRDGAVPKVVDPVEPGMTYEWFGDEYGKLIAADPAHRFRLGEKIKLAVSHSDPTVNLFDSFYLVEDGVVLEVCPIDLRGCSQ